MRVNTPSNWNWTAVGVVITLLMASASLIYNFAISQARDDQQDRDIDRLEAAVSTIDPRLRSMEISLTEIKTTLGILVPRNPDDKK